MLIFISYIFAAFTGVFAAYCYIGKENKDKNSTKKYMPFFIVCLLSFIIFTLISYL